MDDFIKVVEIIESENPALEPLAVLRGLRKASAIDTPFIRHYLGPVNDAHNLVLKATLTDYISSILKHQVVQNLEKGVVLTADGTTVALTPLLLGLEAGLTSTSWPNVPGLFPLSLTKNLALSFLQHSNSNSFTKSHLGTGGCWDDVTHPQVFTLSGVAKLSLATDAVINGGMDGVILGKHVAKPKKHLLTVSSLLRRYYTHQLDSAGLDAAPSLISRLRRSTFKRLMSLPSLKKQLVRSLSIYQRVEGTHRKNKQKVNMDEGLKDFVHSYIDCPVIIPRCMWEAQPYRGTPTRLSLPLSFLYIHHTYQPSQPCLTFQQCSQDMRAMQHYHQDVQGWDDIGYNFVAGSDGYMYEGRGWFKQGAHTKGYNSKGYGVSLIGNYTSSIPSTRTMDIVRNQLAKCATEGGKLAPNYTIHGHRQLVNTACPGDAFYSEIKTWEHFGSGFNSRYSALLCSALLFSSPLTSPAQPWRPFGANNMESDRLHR
ncbi:N-acetylmuramoyl-L-alanine amidase [Bagarius yarrelli]|uniref:N-acetylmuramoyl-L-alanine amidase n=1 Tax=Bagarius yarrelli TaxID=175774 RepID=A0A556TVV3_BAGYA|nr:N-acetylmuramoyl-L-alanine amidase [Bagarius yarrelli]